MQIQDHAGQGVGVLLLSEGLGDDQGQVAVGYLLAESAWGQGFASEVMLGLAAWARDQGLTLFAGVSTDNPASVRVLEKAGFVPNAEPAADGGTRMVLPA